MPAMECAKEFMSAYGRNEYCQQYYSLQALGWHSYLVEVIAVLREELFAQFLKLDDLLGQAALLFGQRFAAESVQ